MWRILTFAAFLIGAASSAFGTAGSLEPTRSATSFFEPNRGQWEGDIQWSHRWQGASSAIDANGIRFNGRRIDWLNGKTNAVELQQARPGVSHFFLGSDPSRWVSNVPTAETLVQRQVWPGVDLVYEATERGLRFDFEVAKASNLATVRMAIPGAKVANGGQSLSLKRHGKTLRISELNAFDRDKKPIALSFVAHGDEQFGFEVTGKLPSGPLTVDPTIDFATFFGGADTDVMWDIELLTPDRSRTPDSATITTILRTFSADMPILAGNSLAGGGEDIVVAKFSADGSALLWSTYIGGSGRDQAINIDLLNGTAAVDQLVALGGNTQSANFPQLGSGCPTRLQNFQDGFVAVLTANGTPQLSCAFGGRDTESVFDVAFSGSPGSNLSVAFAGTTDSTIARGFPAVAAAQPVFGGGDRDAYYGKLSLPTGAPIFISYLGGSGYDDGRTLALTSEPERIVISGTTDSANFPIAGSGSAIDSSCGPPCSFSNWDSYITVVNTTTGAREVSTYVGGNGRDLPGRMESRFGTVTGSVLYQGGQTYSANFPLMNALQNTLSGLADATFSAYRLDGNVLDRTLSTFIGGEGENEFIYGIDVDRPTGDVLLTGFTDSGSTFPEKNALEPALTGAATDGFLVVVRPPESDRLESGPRLRFQSRIGGAGTDQILGAQLTSTTTPGGLTPAFSSTIAGRAPHHSIYFSGSTSSAATPIRRALRQTTPPIDGSVFRGGADGWMGRVSRCTHSPNQPLSPLPVAPKATGQERKLSPRELQDQRLDALQLQRYLRDPDARLWLITNDENRLRLDPDFSQEKYKREAFRKSYFSGGDYERILPSAAQLRAAAQFRTRFYNPDNPQRTYEQWDPETSSYSLLFDPQKSFTADLTSPTRAEASLLEVAAQFRVLLGWADVSDFKSLFYGQVKTSRPASDYPTGERISVAVGRAYENVPIWSGGWGMSVDSENRVFRVSAGGAAVPWPGLRDHGLDKSLAAFRHHFPAMNNLHGKPIGPPKFARDPLSIATAAKSQFIEIPTGFDATRDFLRLHTTRIYYPTPGGLRLAYGFSYAPLQLGTNGSGRWPVKPLAESYDLEQIQRWTLNPSVLIDADSGDVLMIDQLYPGTEPPPAVQNVAPEGRVFVPSPDGTTETRSFAGDSTASPFGWLDKSGTVFGDLQGNNGCVSDQRYALFGFSAGSTEPDTLAVSRPGFSPEAPNGSFVFPFTNRYNLSGGVEFNPDAAATATNAFYWINLAHDRFYSLGFTEANRNFQRRNRVDANGFLVGKEADEVLVYIRGPQSGEDQRRNNAYFAPAPDGVRPLIALQAGLPLPPQIPDARDFALDASVILHEYTHGVTSRLLEGPAREPGTISAAVQTRALSEGWSDFFAGSFLDNPVTGAYVSRNFQTGLRRYAMDNNPLTLANFCKDDQGVQQVPCDVLLYQNASIWSATLWDLRSALRQSIGESEGTSIAEKFAINNIFGIRGPNEPPPNGIVNPSFVQVRVAANTQISVSSPEIAKAARYALACRGFGDGLISGGNDVTNPTPSFRIDPTKNCAGVHAFWNDLTDPVAPGATVPFLLKIRNGSPIPNATGPAVTNVEASIALPTGWSFVSATNAPGFTCSAAANTVTCTAASMPFGESTIPMVLRARRSPGLYTTTANVTQNGTVTGSSPATEQTRVCLPPTDYLFAQDFEILVPEWVCPAAPTAPKAQATFASISS